MGMEPASWAALATAVTAAAGATATIASASNTPKAKKAAGAPVRQEATDDEARKNLEEQELLRQKKGRATTILTGEQGPAVAATTQTGGRTLLG